MFSVLSGYIVSDFDELESQTVDETNFLFVCVHGFQVNDVRVRDA